MKLVLTDKYAELLLLLNGLIILLYFYAKKKKKNRAMEFGNYETLQKVAGKDFLKASNILLISRVLAVTFLIIGISNPTLVGEAKRSSSDYVVAIDSSASMSASDVEPTRLEAAKKASREFVSDLGNQSQTGVVSFSGKVKKEAEITSDAEKLKQSIDSVEMGATAGTAIGNAISTSTSMLLSSDKARIVVITDGRNNVGNSLNNSASFAKAQNISIYPIGIGSSEDATKQYRMIDGENVSSTEYSNLDQDELEEVANMTGGKARFVSNKTGLETAFVDLVSTDVRNDISMIFIWLAALLLVFETIIKTTDLEIIP